MRILEQKLNKLVYRRQQKLSTVAFFIVWGLCFGGIPASIWFGIFASSGVEVLACKRVEPAQVNCHLTQSTYGGLRKGRNISLSQVRGARVNEETDSEGNTLYKVILLTQQGEVELSNNNPVDAVSINTFVKNTKKASLTVQQDNRWPTIFLIPLLLLFVVLGIGTISFSIYTALVIETYTFDKTLGKLTKQRKFCLINQVEEYPRQDIIDVKVQEKLDGDGDKFHQVSLLLVGGRRLILMPFFSVGSGETERKVVKTISQFINHSKTK